MGIHPEENRMLMEEEEALSLSMLRFFKRRDLLNIKQPNEIERLAQLWLSYFPTIDKYLPLKNSDLFQALWKIVFEKTEILGLGYAFYPMNLSQQQGQVCNESNRIQGQMGKEFFLVPKGKVVYTFPFSAAGPIGKIVEGEVGLSSILKRRVGLTNYSPGLICNYLLSENRTIEDLDPYQFEDLVGIIFKEEGWDILKTSKSRDGGKDIIAISEINGNRSVIYIQAKRYSKNNKVGISVVKEFVATVAGDKVDKGIIASSSTFSKPCTNWVSVK